MTKRLLVVAGALLLIAVALPGTVEAQTPPPHKDPRAGAAEFNPISLLEYFGTIVGLLAQGNYGNAQDLSEQLQHANIPEDLRFIIERYSELLGSLRNELEFTESSLREASASIDRGDAPAARQQLEAAGSSLEKAKRLLEDLQVSTETVARRLGIFGAPASALLRKAYEQLQALLTRLDELWSRYAATLERLEAAAEAVETSGGGGTPEPPTIYQTELQFEISSPAYPGQVTPISGQVTAIDGPDPVTVFLRVLLDQNLIDSFSTTAAFQQNIEIPATTLFGRHVLTVELPPQGRYAGRSASKEVELIPQERYAGTSASTGLEIIQASSQLTVRSPLLTFLPQSIPASGEITSVLGPLRDPKVMLRVGDAQTQLQTDDQGQFSGSVDLSLSNNLFLGPQTLEVTVQPAEPMYGVLTQRITLFIINITNLAILSMVALCIPSALTMAWRKQHNNQTFTASGSPALPIYSVPGVSVIPGLPLVESRTYVDTSSTRGRVVFAYHSAARFLELSLAMAFLPSFTLRDFLIAIDSQANAAFTDLTSLAERALYATQHMDEGEARRAERLAQTVQEEVR